jgi:hypothetical protein
MLPAVAVLSSRSSRLESDADRPEQIGVSRRQYGPAAHYSVRTRAAFVAVDSVTIPPPLYSCEARIDVIAVYFSVSPRKVPKPWT